MKKITLFKTAALLTRVGSISCLSGCASMFGDNNRSITVNSTPEGAYIYVDNTQYGTTPMVVTLPSFIYGGKTVTFKKPGYVTQSMQVNTAYQLVGLWNILNFPLGMVVDFATGDSVRINPPNLQLNANLQPGQDPVTPTHLTPTHS